MRVAPRLISRFASKVKQAYAQVLAWRRELFTHDDGEVLP